MTRQKKNTVRGFYTSAFNAAHSFDGSERADQAFYKPLILLDEFISAQNVDRDEASEKQVAHFAFPEGLPANMPETIDGFLDIASKFYDHLRNNTSDVDIYGMIENAGGIIKESDQVFVKTDEGHIQYKKSDHPESYRVETEPRLAMIIDHLRNDGVNGQPIYMDDIVVTRGSVSNDMMRDHPYNIVQIPRIDMEIAVCDQIGQTTFIKKGVSETKFWGGNLTKNQLKSRGDINHVDRHNDEQWWNDISKYLSDEAQPTKMKVNVKRWSPPLDRESVKATLLAHYRAEGDVLTRHMREYILKHGEYADGVLTIGALDHRLNRQFDTSVSDLYEELAFENEDLIYRNPSKIKQITLEQAKATLLAHFHGTGKPLLTKDREGEKGKPGSYVLRHGPDANGITTAGAFDLRARDHLGISIADINEELANENPDFIYKNKRNLEKLDRNKVKQTMLLHHILKGVPLVPSARASDEEKPGSYIMEHGHYADGELTAGAFRIRVKDHLFITLPKLYDEITLDLGMNGKTSSQRKAELKGFLQNVKEGVFAEFNGDSTQATAYIESLTLNDYVIECELNYSQKNDLSQTILEPQ